jgi:phage shock protein A
MPKPKAPLTNPALLAAVLGLAGCNTPSMEDFQRVENEVAELRARVEAAEAQADESSLSADSALDSAGQCNQVCGQVSDRLDELYLEIMPR